MERYVGSVFRARLHAMFPFVAADWAECILPVLPDLHRPLRHISGNPVALCHLPSGHGLVFTPCTQDMGFLDTRQTVHTWRIWFVSLIHQPLAGYVRDLSTVDRQLGDTPQASLTRVFSPQIVALQNHYIDHICAACLTASAPVEELYFLDHTNVCKGQFQVRGRGFSLAIDFGVPSEDLLNSYVLAALDSTDTEGPYPRRWYLSLFFYQIPHRISLPVSAHAQAACLRNALIPL